MELWFCSGQCLCGLSQTTSELELATSRENNQLGRLLSGVYMPLQSKQLRHWKAIGQEEGDGF